MSERTMARLAAREAKNLAVVAALPPEGITIDNPSGSGR